MHTGRRRRRDAPPYGEMLAWLLALPARCHVRWMLILAAMTFFAGIYLSALLTAGPLPPSRVPTTHLGTAWHESRWLTTRQFVWLLAIPRDSSRADSPFGRTTP